MDGCTCERGLERWIRRGKELEKDHLEKSMEGSLVGPKTMMFLRLGTQRKSRTTRSWARLVFILNEYQNGVRERTEPTTTRWPHNEHPQF